MPPTAAHPHIHRHGRRLHSHPNRGPHRHLRLVRRSEPVAEPQPPDPGHARAGHAHDHAYVHVDAHGEHGHSHGLVHDSIKRSREGIRAVSLSLAVLGLTAIAQTVVFLASGSIALLADLIHNYGDALTAVPLGIAFALHSELA